jgi:processive 1,2-diacylglycerol beta-glucosyltransferase
MIRLFDRETASEIGTITEDQLDFLIANLEEEETRDQDYYINGETIQMLVEKGMDGELHELLENALGNRKDMEVLWEDAT